MDPTPSAAGRSTAGSRAGGADGARAERCEETGREEMAVRVVEAGYLRFGHRRGLWRRGGSPNSRDRVCRRATPRAFAHLDSILASMRQKLAARANAFSMRVNLCRVAALFVRRKWVTPPGGTVKLAFVERAGTLDRDLSSSQAAIVTASQMRKERPRSSR